MEFSEKQTKTTRNSRKYIRCKYSQRTTVLNTEQCLQQQKEVSFLMNHRLLCLCPYEGLEPLVKQQRLFDSKHSQYQPDKLNLGNQFSMQARVTMEATR
ncbi:unnamed protein product [Onchocerca flexuosa]|uniref:Ovule protein n=1 Tax=Onchocerca flexuosa TaxID=387005 RepID=A0A183I352_9BILA|nr:unnamed protein product [Onchocerca flexuosa]